MTVKLTYHQFLSTLEAEERNRFIENTSQEILDEFLSSNETKNWLVNAFDWYISPEGFYYWRKINDRIFHNENQTATKEVVKEAMEAVSKDVLAPKCVRDGIVNQNQIGDVTKKVSSVEWYRNQLHILVTMRDTPYKSESEIFEKSKQMHKDEMIEAMNKAQIIDDVDFDGNVTFVFNNIEQYYNNTF